MSHHHHHHHGAERNITLALILNATFVVVEIVGGILTNSIAILSDALHDTGDTLSLGIALYLQRKSKREGDSTYSYGYKRFTLMGSLFLSGLLLVSSLFVITKAVGRIITPEEVNATGMLWIAIFGVVINGAAALRLRGGHSLNERAVYIHMMEDILGWVSVLVVSVVIRFYDVPILDPILSILISVWMLYNVFKILRETFRVLLQAVPSSISISALEAAVLKIEGVISIHHIHVWSQDGESHVMTLHVVSDEENTRPIMNQIINLSSGLGIEHVTIQFESSDFICF